MIRLLMCLQERLIQLSDGRNLRYDRTEESEVTPMSQDEKEKDTFLLGGGANQRAQFWIC